MDNWFWMGCCWQALHLACWLLELHFLIGVLYEKIASVINMHLWFALFVMAKLPFHRSESECGVCHKSVLNHELISPLFCAELGDGRLLCWWRHRPQRCSNQIGHNKLFSAHSCVQPCHNVWNSCHFWPHSSALFRDLNSSRSGISILRPCLFITALRSAVHSLTDDIALLLTEKVNCMSNRISFYLSVSLHHLRETAFSGTFLVCFTFLSIIP